MAAFVGWQHFRTQMTKKCRIRNFEEYRKSLGIQRPQDLTSKATEIDTAKKILEEVGLGNVFRSFQPKRRS